DGIIAALQILTALRHRQAKLADLVADLPMYTQHMENIEWPRGRDWTANQALVKANEEAQQLLGAQGRVLIRPSGTEPKLRIMVEALDTELLWQAMDGLLAAANKMEYGDRGLLPYQAVGQKL